MTGAKNNGKKTNQSPGRSQGRARAPAGFEFERLCTTVGDLCNNADDADDDIIPRIQEMLRERSEETGLDNNAATAVAVSQLLLPVMGLSSRNIDKRLDKQETAINKLRASVRLNAYENDRLQQYTRRENIRISGITEAEGEQLKAKIVNIASDMGLNIDESAINACHRLGPARQGTRARAVIVRFFARDVKHDFLVNKNKLKNMEQYRGVYVNEDLTLLRSKLLQYVKRQDGVESAYTREGKVICRLRDGSRVTVETPDDLFKIGLTSIDFVALGLGSLE